MGNAMIRRNVNLREEGYGEAGRSLSQQECEKNSRTDNLEQDEECQMISLYPIHNPCSHHLLKNFSTPDCNVNSLILLDEKPCQDFQVEEKKRIGLWRSIYENQQIKVKERYSALKKNKKGEKWIMWFNGDVAVEFGLKKGV
ncbi:hypothetical protein H0E87_008064 [Populus deltoides]|uniref:Uncharacterized protein n=1 Tax=Populus deltoides TaxID=3696 RepID=A0A8T2YZ55_POPDE|nr:hypothetical protein H0E87_008064 [Populus deltoides]